MKRLFAIALVASIGNASAAFAGESLLSAGTRHVQQIAVTEGASESAATQPATAQKPLAAFQTQGSTLSKSGMGKGKKALIYVGLAVGLAASVWTIDHHVLDVTPSSLGTRKD